MWTAVPVPVECLLAVELSIAVRTTRVLQVLVQPERLQVGLLVVQCGEHGTGE